MMNLRTEQLRILIGAIVLGLLLAAGTAFATQRPCTTTTTSTTLPECPEPTVCEPVFPCPDPAPCQPVECKDGNDGTTTVVTVDRCPEPEVYEFCKVRKNGETVCYRSKATKNGKPGPRRVLVPRSIMDKIADEQRGY